MEVLDNDPGLYHEGDRVPVGEVVAMNARACIVDVDDDETPTDGN